MNFQSGTAISSLHLKEVLVAEQYAEIVGDHIRTFQQTDSTKGETISHAALTHLGQLYGGDSERMFRKPFLFIDGFAVIPVHGLLLNKFSSYWGYVTGYNYIRSMMNAALADEEVEAIVLDINTPGGEAAGCPELADEIYAAREIKPIVAMVDANAYSAGCWIMSAASPGRVFITPSGGTGSVGVISMHVSMKGMLEDFGVKVTLMYAGEHKADGNPFEDLPDSVREERERVLAEIYGIFTAAVARNRGIPEKAVRDTQARIFRANEALRLGFVDAVRSAADAISARFAAVETPDDGHEPEEETEDMTTQTPNGGTTPDTGTAAQTDAAALAAANKAGAAAERERSKAILTAPEAAGKSDLANHLAYDTDLSAEAAIAILAKAPSSTKTAAAAEGDAKQANAFQAAMDNAEHPNLNPLDDDKTKPSAAQRMIAAQAKAHGDTPKTKH